MNIMYVVSNLEKCGPINVLFNIVKEVEKKHECEIVTLSKENSKSMLKDFSDLNIEIIQLNMDRNEHKQSYVSNLKDVIAKYQPSIIHTHGYRSDQFIKILNNDDSFKHVTTLHNFPFNDYPKVYGLIKGTFLALFHVHIISRISYKISCSHSIANEFMRCKISGISTIQNGVDVSVYRTLSNSEKHLLRKKLGLPVDKKIVISTGALIKRKRPFRLLEAFSKFNEIDGTFFLVLGDGELFNKLYKYQGPYIKLLGSVNNVAEYLQASDVFISNSKAEGLPMAMLEAASTGLIIVGSDILPHREVQEIHSSKTILYQGQNAAKIEKCIRMAIKESEEIIVSEEVKFKLSSYNMAQHYLNYYNNLKVI